MTTITLSQIHAVVDTVDFGKPSAQKRGRNPRWPYVPVILSERTPGSGFYDQQRQLRGLAFATREEAIACAERSIERERRDLAKRLADPRHRAEREFRGLPREIDGVDE